MPFVVLNIALLFWKLSVSVFQHGTYVTIPRSVAPSATALQQDVYLLPMQFPNLLIFLVSHVGVLIALTDLLLLFSCFLVFFTLLFCPVLSYFVFVFVLTL
jgi:hypothetical protein